MTRQHENKAKRVYIPVTSFGAALGAMFVATNVDATVISLTASPGTVASGSTVDVQLVGLGGSGPAFSIYNGDSTTNYLSGGSAFQIAGFASKISGVKIAASDSITASLTFNTSVSASTDANKLFFGFVTTDGELGWLQIDFNFGGTITFLAAAFNDAPGESIHVGTVGETASVPEPSSAALMSLGLLALGASGVRTHRRRRAAKGEIAPA